MSYLYSDLITQFRNIIRDPASVNNRFFEDDEILVHFLDGLNYLVREVGLSVFKRSLPINSSTADYNAPCDSMKIMEIRNSDGVKILPTTIERLESLNMRWFEQSGDVRFYVLERGVKNFRLKFFKKPSTSETLTIKAWRLPSQGENSPDVGDSPELDTAITKLLLDYVLAMGFLKKDERTLYQFHLNRFEKDNIKAAKKYIRRSDDGVPRLASNEEAYQHQGRLPDNYPIVYR